MRLYIAEKPSMAREIANVLQNPQRGKGYIKTSGGIVTWLVGHVLQQVPPDGYDEKYKLWREEDLPIIPKVWKLEVNPKTAEQFEIVKNLIAHADEIIHAGDPDREGQLLVDEVLEYVGNKKPVKRILLNALDETSIRRANARLRENKEFYKLKETALGRSRADWLIGMNLSRAYTIRAQRLGHEGVFPIGRVKTPTLAIVVRREREIENFKAEEYYNLRAEFEHANGNFIGQYAVRLTDKKVAERLIEKLKGEPLCGKISSYVVSEKKESPPMPYSLSTLQIEAGKMFGYKPQEVLDAAQSLYEKKLTTYPRSDCEYLPTTQYKDAKEILRHLARSTDEKLKKLANGADTKIKSRAWNDKKITAHHAIIPTLLSMTGGLTKIEEEIYNLIAKNYAVQFYPMHIYDETKVEVSYKDEVFTARGKVIKQNGWREFYKVAKAEEETEILPLMKRGDEVIYKKSELKKSKTKPPVRFTASSLVQGMKEIHKYVKNPESKKQLKDVYGIGTEATRARIIDELIERGFLKFMGKKKSLQPTEQAYTLIDALPDDLTYPDATAIWEDKLHSMQEGVGTLEEFMEGQIKFTTELCKKARNANIQVPEGKILCPKCKSGILIKRKGKFGEFFGCSNYPRCKFTTKR